MEDLFKNFYDEYFDTSRTKKPPTTNEQLTKVDLPPSIDKVIQEVSQTTTDASSPPSSLSEGNSQQSVEEDITVHQKVLNP